MSAQGLLTDAKDAKRWYLRNNCSSRKSSSENPPFDFCPSFIFYLNF